MSDITITTDPAVLSAGKKKRFVVFYKESILSVKTTDIAYFAVDEGTVHLVTLGGKRYKLKKTIGEIVKTLDEHLFFQVSRSTIVSFEAIDRVEAFFGQRAVIFLKPSGKTVVTKGRLTDFLSWLDQ